MTTTQKEKRAEMQTSSVYYGDCFKHLTHWNNWNRWDENNNARLKMDRKLVDLIYLDPPWNSDTYYNVTYETPDNKAKGNTAQSTVFTDVWEWGDAANDRLKRLTKDYISPNDPFYPLLRARDCVAGLELVLRHDSMLAYLTYMAERLAMCRELLKETGSIYLHCDPTAGHYLKTLMDAIFGKENYRNDIVWSYSSGGVGKKWFARKHDYILFYCKNHKAKPTFHLPRQPTKDEKRFNKTDEDGRKYYDKGGGAILSRSRRCGHRCLGYSAGEERQQRSARLSHAEAVEVIETHY